MATRQAVRKAAQRARDVSNTEALLTIGEACEILNVHANTLRRWGQMGLLRVRRLGPRGDRRFRREDVEALFRARSD